MEILNHYGSHYYCTVSNVRVYGASEYEVLDHQDSEPHETETSDYEELIGEFAPDAPEPRAPDYGAGRGGGQEVFWSGSWSTVCGRGVGWLGWTRRL